ncbi:MAG TPA: hypothetical protein VHQ42_03640 [Candidatus Limnocylindria bacterium]|nr:hypothetical protein [Candidatus Limnocylindria bacterium]
MTHLQHAPPLTPMRTTGVVALIAAAMAATILGAILILGILNLGAANVSVDQAAEGALLTPAQVEAVRELQRERYQEPVGLATGARTQPPLDWYTQFTVPYLVDRTIPTADESARTEGEQSRLGPR